MHDYHALGLSAHDSGRAEVHARTATICAEVSHAASLSTLTNIFGVNKQYTLQLEYFVFVHYMSKFLDFFDTLFIILRGKEKQQLTFLHVYHHASIGMIWGAMLYIGHGNGTAAFGCLINSIIHCIMYSHYFWTSMGYTNPFKKFITQAQLIQFAMCIVHACLVLAFETILPRHLAWAQFVYHIQVNFAMWICFEILTYFGPDAHALRTFLQEVVHFRSGSKEGDEGAIDIIFRCP
eukprot:767342-Hanusia_phi.AAC.2